MSATKSLRRALGQPDVVKLALADELGERAHCVLNADLGVNPCGLEEIDLLRAAQRSDAVVNALAEFFGSVSR